MSGSALLEPGFARELEALRRRMQSRARSGGGGERAANRRGGSAEFMEHRPYAPGDDLRRIDWLAFARTGEPVFKLFRAEEDAIVRLLVDTSASLDAGEPTKLLVAKKIAASIAYMALADSERAQIIASGEGITRASEPRRGRSSLPGVLRELDMLTPGGRTDLARSIDQTLQRSERPGMLVVLSDFMDEAPFDAALTRARAAGHDLALVQVLTPEEMDPPYEGDLALEDSETGAIVEVTMDVVAVTAYASHLDGLIRLLGSTAKRLGATYVRVVTDEPIVSAVRRFVSRGVD